VTPAAPRLSLQFTANTFSGLGFHLFQNFLHFVSSAVYLYRSFDNRPQWPHGLRHQSAAARLLGL
jgi:hypothetical protein